MHTSHLDVTTWQEENSDVTRRLRHKGKILNKWLSGAHQQSEGEYLEHLVREELRRHLPERYRVSTGFISTAEPLSEDENTSNWKRTVSRQFDILVWDAKEFAPLFEVGEFAVIMPVSCIAILEVTSTLRKRKLLKDMEKFDDLVDIYFSPDRQTPYPYTALVGFTGKTKLSTTRKHLEIFYYHESDVPLPWRYTNARKAKGFSTIREVLPGYMNALCVLDKGLLRGKICHDRWTTPRWRVRYDEYRHRTDEGIEDSFGLLQREVARWAARRTVSGGFFINADVPREFSFNPVRPSDSQIWIMDWSELVPNRNISATNVDPSSENPFSEYASDFVGIDHLHSSPFMYHEEIDVDWAIERVDEDIWTVGKRKDNRRKGEWRLVKSTDNGWGSGIIRLDLETGNILASDDDSVLGNEADFVDVIIDYARDSAE